MTMVSGLFIALCIGLRIRRRAIPWYALLLVALGVGLGPVPVGAQAPPAAPTIGSVTAAETSISVSWTAPPGVSGIVAYDVRHIRTEADETDDANWTVVDNAWTSGNLEYTIVGLAKGTGYDVQVRAVTSSNGQWSSTSDATTLTTVPGAPTLGSLTPGESALGAVWSKPVDTGGAPITSYDLRYSEAGQASWTEIDDAWAADNPDPTAALTRIIENLTAGTSYDVQVRAQNSEGTSAWSDTTTGTPVTDHSGKRVDATTIVLGAITNGSIRFGTENDWFKLVLTEQREVVLFSRGALDTVGELTDADGKRITANDDAYLSHGIRNFAIARRLAAGTYYLRVGSFSSRTGDFLLQTLSFADTTGIKDAKPLSFEGPSNQIVGVSRDQDWFSFVLSQQTTVAVTGSGAGTLSGSLRDASDAAVSGVTTIKMSPVDFVLRATLDAGTYYVRVTGSGAIGLYAVWLDAVAEPGAGLNNAATLSLSNTGGGNIDAADDVDYFKIEVSEDTYVQGVARGGGAGVNIEGELLDQDGNKQEGVDIQDLESGPTGFEFRLRLDGPDSGSPRTWYLKVSRRDGSLPTSGHYALRMWEDTEYAGSIARCEALSAPYSDPLSGCQWHLVNTGQLNGTAGEDVNISGIAATHTGAGVNIAVVDDGVHTAHEDLRDNADTTKNYDYTSRKTGQFDRNETHGTAVAGVIAARNNDIGVRGVAPQATIYGFNLLQNSTDRNKADAVTRHMVDTAINTNSWGTITYAQWHMPPSFWDLALEQSLSQGFGGKGTLHVRAGGNDALLGDNANLNGMQNHYGVVTVCAVNDQGIRSLYSEPGANLWVCGPSNDRSSRGRPGITTTTPYRYRFGFGGTSSAAPAVTGVAALVRAADASLTWRDVKLILAGSARQNDPSNPGWEPAGQRYGPSGGNYQFNHEYGFGVVDATAAVNLATGWTALPPFREKVSTKSSPDKPIPDRSGGVNKTIESTVSIGPYVEFIEYVAVHVNLVHYSIRDLEVTLTSPSGTVSSLADRSGKPDGSPVVFTSVWNGTFRFGSARHLGEDPAGEWTLSVTDTVSGSTGRLRSWSMTIYGHGQLPDRPTPDVADYGSGPGELIVDWFAPDQQTGEPAIDRYDVRYIRSDAEDKTDPNNWTVVERVWTTGDGALTETIDGLAGGTLYDIQVRAGNSAGVGDWSEVFSGRSSNTAPGPPVITEVVPGNGSLHAYWDEPVNTGGTRITSYDLQYRVQPSGSWTTVDPATSGARSYRRSGLTNDTTYDVRVRAVNAIGDGEWSSIELGKPREVNRIPQFAADETGERSISENTPAGTDVGRPFTATDADDDKIRYSISNWGAQYFTIDEETGQLSTKDPLDYETRRSYAVTVSATDVAREKNSMAVTINVIDENEPPVLTGRTFVYYGSQGTGPVTTYRVDDPEREAIVWSLSGPDSGAFGIVGGVLRFLTSPSFDPPGDVDGDNDYELTIHAEDSGFNHVSLDVVVSVWDRDGPPPPTVDPPGPTPQPPGGGGGGGGGGAPPIPVPSDEDFDWTVTHDLESLDNEHDLPTGMWSDGRLLWILDNAATGADTVYVYELKGGERSEQHGFELDRRNRFSHGIWSEGDTIWVADSGQDRLFAYNQESGERQEGLEVELDERNRDPRGIWSDVEHWYVLDAVKDALFVYNFETGALQAEHALDKLNKSPRGIWSDGVTIWVSDDGAKRLFAYEVVDGALVRNEDLEFTFRFLLKAGNGDARGIWSDGEVVYVVDAQDDKVYSYNIPDAIIAYLSELELSEIDVGEFSPQRLDYNVDLEQDLETTTVNAKPSQEAATLEIEPADSDGDPENGHQVKLEEETTITVTVISPDGSRSRPYRIQVRQASALRQDCLQLDDKQLFAWATFSVDDVESLEQCARSHEISAVYHLELDALLVREVWTALFIDAPAFLNQPFRERFADGVPPTERFIVKREIPNLAPVTVDAE